MFWQQVSTLHSVYEILLKQWNQGRWGQKNKYHVQGRHITNPGEKISENEISLGSCTSADGEKY